MTNEETVATFEAESLHTGISNNQILIFSKKPVPMTVFNHTYTYRKTLNSRSVDKV